MNVIIDFDVRHPPILWTEMNKFDKIFRTDDDRNWCEMHRHARESYSTSDWRSPWQRSPQCCYDSSDT